jgi:hypothetical protein
MPRRSPTDIAYPPLYVLRAGEWCPACGEGTNAYALLAAALYERSEDDTFPGPLLLNHVERLPKRILALLAGRCPGWRFDREDDSSEPPYLMNHCWHCDAKLTDCYTHGEPGSAFCPASLEEGWNISVFLLPVEAAVPLVCSWSAGGLTEWLALDEAQEWEALPPVAAV